MRRGAEQPALMARRTPISGTRTLRMRPIFSRQRSFYVSQAQEALV